MMPLKKNLSDNISYDKTINYPKISIVTPSFNQGQYIEETILSIINQNYPNLEYIIIDGGSTDNTIEIIKKYEKWLTYWVSEPDQGQAHAINKGLKKCTGEIFNWINSDDYLEKDALEFIGRKFQQHVDIDVICGKMKVVKNNKVILNTTGAFVSNSLEETIAKSYIEQPSTFFRLSVFKINCELSLNYLFDVEIWIRYLITHGITNILKVNNYLCYFRFHDQSKTVSSYNKFIQEKIILLEALKNLYTNADPTLYYYKKWKKLNPIPINQHDYLIYIRKELFTYYFASNQFDNARTVVPYLKNISFVNLIKKTLLLLPNNFILFIKKLKNYFTKNHYCL